MFSVLFGQPQTRVPTLNWDSSGSHPAQSGAFKDAQWEASDVPGEEGTSKAVSNQMYWVCL